MLQKHRFKVDKLIRDKIPDIMRQGKIILAERVMEREEYLQRLKDKLKEEAQEVAEATTQTALKEELADVLEVLLALGLAYGLSYEEIEATRLKKQKEKGGFAKRIYNEYVEMDVNNENLDYYLSRPRQYPKMK